MVLLIESLFQNCCRSTFDGLRLDTDYVIRISFVLSGRKLGSESYTILSPEGSKYQFDTVSFDSLNEKMIHHDFF